jgi:hypothetical protein
MKIQYAACLLLAALTGCADVDSDSSESLSDQGATTQATNSRPIAVIDVSAAKRIEFHQIGPELVVEQLFPIGDAPILSQADKELSAVELYKKFAPGSVVPAALYDAQVRTPSNDLEEISPITSNETGGGSPAPQAQQADASKLSQALSQGDGCNPPQSNVVFADCRFHWFGGYFAEGVPTWFLDSRVAAVSGSLDAKFTSKFSGGTFFNTFHVAQGQVSNLHWPKSRVCKTILGVEISCSDVKSARRLDVINAANTTFNVDVVFFN